MRRTRYLLVLGIVAGLVTLGALSLSGCGPGHCSKEELGASNWLPFLPDDKYQQLDTSGLEDALRMVQLWTEVLDTPVATQIQAIDGLIQCVRDTDAIGVRAFVHRESRHVAGVALVINYDRLASWDTAVTCFRNIVDDYNRQVGDALTLRPCASWWKFEQQDCTFFAFEAGTSPYICEAMCKRMAECPQWDMLAELVP